MTRTLDSLAHFVANPCPPDSARRMAAKLLVDTLGVAAAARDLTPARIARDFAVDFHAASDPANAVPLLFDGRPASIPGASFALATQIDNLDGHDGYNPTKGHIGCAVVPALLAFAQARPDLSSMDALDQLVMSYEIGARAAMALHATVTDYHTSGAWNALAVAALGCSLRDANATQLRHALGIAEYHGPRSQMMREIANPTMLHDGSGMGAMNGSMAALMALRGFEGAPAITVEHDEVAQFWDDLGRNWTIEENYIKPYPVCRWAHAPLDGLHDLMQQYNLTADQIARLDVFTFKESAALFPGIPSTTGQAQYSLGFALAAMMVRGKVGPAEITSHGMSDPAIATVLPRISIHEATRHSDRFPARRCANLAVTLTDGHVLESGDLEARGGPEAPLTDDEVHAKLHLFAEPVLGQARTQALWDIQEKMLSPSHKFAELIALVARPPSEVMAQG